MGEDVEKSLYLSYTEILKGLHFIKDAIDFVEQGKDYYVIPLSGQLRAISVSYTHLTLPTTERV